MAEERTLRVEAADDGKRLDRLLVAWLSGYARRQIEKLLRSGQVRLNGEVVTTGRRVRSGDVVSLPALVSEATHEAPQPQPELPLTVLHLGTSWLALDKPAGMPTHPHAPHGRDTLANALVARYPETRDAGRNPLEAGLLHRLDNETSGVLVAARTKPGFTALHDQFRAGQVVKTYLALVHGKLSGRHRIERPIVALPGRRRVRAVEESDAAATGAQAATTEIEAIEELDDVTLVRAQIRQGARHQIRAHLAAMGHPIVGDSQYGETTARLLSRHFLHACLVELQDPDTNERRALEAALPVELQSYLTGLRER